MRAAGGACKGRPAAHAHTSVRRLWRGHHVHNSRCLQPELACSERRPLRRRLPEGSSARRCPLGGQLTAPCCDLSTWYSNPVFLSSQPPRASLQGWQGLSGALDLFLVGGFQDKYGYGEEIVARLLSAFEQHPAAVRLQLACVSCLNSGPAGEPRCAGVAFDTARRAVQPGTIHLSYHYICFMASRNTEGERDSFTLVYGLWVLRVAAPIGTP